jgi:hypothetical protein
MEVHQKVFYPFFSASFALHRNDFNFNTMTILEHFKSFSEPYRSQAIKNLYPNMANRSMNTSFEALIVGFFWNDTPKDQGFEYWSTYCNKLKKQYEKTI